MKQSLQLKQGLQLSLTPQLQQAIYLLQLNSLELQQEIQLYLESNPLLELEPHESLPIDESNETDDNFETLDLSSDAINNLSEEEWNSTYATNDSHYPQASLSELLPEDNASSFDLKHDLLWQLNLIELNNEQLVCAYFLIDYIGDNGLLTQPAKDVYNNLQQSIKLSFGEFEHVRQEIQQLDPTGCACESLAEFLLLQLQAISKETPFRQDAIYLLKRHAHLLAKHDYALLQKRSRFDQERLEQSLSLIQGLKPEPYTQISATNSAAISPDLLVTKHQQQWLVQLNRDNQIPLKINQQYVDLAKQIKHSDDQQYIQNNLQEARWLIRSLQNREETLLKVASKIIDFQQEFLEHGEIAMAPLTLAQIADAIDMHESTVSRATTGKYIHTPRGMFELKFFFSQQMATNSGDDCSSTAIRAMIKSMVENEDTQRPLSDNKITQLLKQEGIQIARRTVAKYREELFIPPSNERKRLVKLKV